MTKRSPVSRLRGQTALITGASRGIGLAIARALAGEGCNLILTSRDEKALARISRELSRKKIRILAHPCDVRDPYAVDDLFRSIRHHFRRIDILINNAGVAHANLTVDKLPYPVWKDVLATNLDGTFLVTQAALMLIPRGGTIVNNLSIAATRVFAGSAAYNASKHGALGLAGGTSSSRNPRDRAFPWRYRHRDMEDTLARGSEEEDDGERDGGSGCGERGCFADECDRRNAGDSA